MRQLSAPSIPLSSSKQTPHSSTPLASANGPPGSQRRDKLSWLDLIALAPERKQAVSAVQKGWSGEAGGVIGGGGGGDAGDGGVKDSELNSKELSHRVHG